MSAAPERVRALAPAKVNLALAVLGRRADGYHELDTWMLALELADELVLSRGPGPGVEVELGGPFASADIPRDERNLAARAARTVLEEARRRGRASAGEGLRLQLVKNVPSQAGLGAGSADAAAAWLAGAALFGLGTADELAERELAALGSDCVFFWKARSTGFARCLGRGEAVEPRALDARGRAIAILAPAVAAPTARVYAALNAPLSSGPPGHSVRPVWFEAPLDEARAEIRNDLERAALEAVPELASWRAGLDACGAGHYRLSGSGSSFFALHLGEPEARAELERLQSELAARGLRSRGHWVTRPLGAGARILAVG